jgi:hypothetical protein
MAKKKADPSSAVRKGEVFGGKLGSKLFGRKLVDPVSAVRRGEIKPPSAKVGNYRAPVDTVGMDAEMKETMGFGKKKKK